ncbi:MAG TPA: SMI1/KNR4 family protein [Polyangiaceae bacterium]
MVDETRLFQALDAVVAHLARLGRPVVSVLQPGLTPAEIARVEATLPFLLTEEIKAVYRWRNGIVVSPHEVLGNLWIVPGFYLPSLEHARQRFEGRKLAPQWRKGWYPLFEDGAGGFYIVPCKKKPTDRAPVIGFIHGEPEQPVEYLDVTTMIETFADSFAQGAVFVNDEGNLDIDDDAHAEIARRHNPGVAVWQS